MSRAFSMVRMAVGGFVPINFDFDSRVGVVGDGGSPNRVASWTDLIAALVATTPTTSPVVDTTLAVTTLRYDSSARSLSTPASSFALANTGPYSVTMRFRPTIIAGNGTMWSLFNAGGSRTQLQHIASPTSTLRLSRFDGTTLLTVDSAAHGMVNNTFYTIGVTWAAGVAYFYKDGAPLTSVAFSNTLGAPTPHRFAIGNNNVASQSTLGSFLHRVRFYLAAISAGQHLRDHNDYAAVI